MTISNRLYFIILFVIFVIEWVLLAINPHYRDDWLLENLLVFIGIAVILLIYNKTEMSRTSYTLIFMFLYLHEIGAHYTYSEVPYDTWFSAISGGTSFNELVGWQRNNFDRVIHFSYGLLLVYPVRELLLKSVTLRGFWSYCFPLVLIMASSMIYEFIEWSVVELLYEDLGMAYLGTQGDIWDGHKDMALASLGALIAVLLAPLFKRTQVHPIK